MTLIASAMPHLASVGMTARSVLLLMLVVVFGVVGDLAMKHGLSLAGEFDPRPRALPRSILRAAASGWVWLGFSGMVGSFFSLLVLLSAAPASSVIPATAGTFVLDTLGARFVLKEHVSGARWMGAVLVALGVGLVAR